MTDDERRAWEMVGKCNRQISDLADALNRQTAEVARLKRGDFTEEEFQTLCHNMKPDDLRRFRAGCEDYQAKLFGLKKPKDEAERQLLKKHYDGKTSPCCECGEDYPRGDLVIDMSIYCPKCREIKPSDRCTY